MGCAFLFADRLRLNVHRGPHVGAPQQFLLDFKIHTKLPEHGAVGVPKRMPPTLPAIPAVTAAGLIWFSKTAVDRRGSSPASWD
jgi:hypothetical protein